LTSWNLADILDAVAADIPSAPAIVATDRQLSWAQFEAEAESLAADLDALGLPHQAKVAVYLRNVPEFLVSYSAALKASYVPVNVNYRYAADEIVYLLTDCEAQAVVVSAEYAEIVLAVADRLPLVRRWYVVGELPSSLAASLSGLVQQGRVFPYSEAVRRAPSERRHTRSGDDLLLIYTGGTTGMP
jgi:acyl-CoA synthetase (AMP-forming)/AMP-acid ligase II